MELKSYAVIAAAGSGTRMGGISKPNIKILGKTLFEYVLDAFCSSCVKGITVVCSADNIDSLKELAKGSSKPVNFVLGGKTRAESIFNGVSACEDGDIICAHDCARPFITAELINEAIDAASEFGASCLCMPVTDTLKHKDPLTGAVSTPNRDDLFAVQTPQCFKKEIYLRAKEKAGEEYCNFTDETSLLEFNGCEVKYIKKLQTNMKLTALDDVPIAEILMKQRLEQ